MLECASQVHLELHTALHNVLHSRLKDDVPVLAVPLGAVHRDVGVAQKVLHRCALPGGDPDARGHGDSRVVAAREDEWGLQRLAQALGDQLGVRCLAELFGEHDELVAADASQGGGVAYGAVEPRGDRLQQVVADGVPERVVYAGEVVEVDQQRRDAGVQPSCSDEHLLATVEDQRPVRQPCQRIVRCHEHELLVAAGELIGDPCALLLERLAHADQRHIERSLHHRRGRGERRERDVLLISALVQHLDHDIAPA